MELLFGNQKTVEADIPVSKGQQVSSRLGGEPQARCDAAAMLRPRQQQQMQGCFCCRMLTLRRPTADLPPNSSLWQLPWRGRETTC